ncbi:MAG: Rrf2 family transcriptional regulator [Isosphaeraceae bacterium]
MTVSAKCYYALRAIYALAEHQGSVPLKANEIAERQHIPIKFLEAILSQLKGGGYVTSRRGVEGGYLLARPSDRLKLGEIIRFIDGPIAPVDCVSVSSPKECEYPGHCPFFEFWGRVRQAISDVVDQTTFADLIKENASLGLVYIPEWTI